MASVQRQVFASFPRNCVTWPHRPAVAEQCGLELPPQEPRASSTRLFPTLGPSTMPPLRPRLPAPRSTFLRKARLPARPFTTTFSRRQDAPEPPRYNFYRTHGRAFFKAFTLAFLTMQLVHWAWLVVETEEENDTRAAEIKALESEVRLLDEGRRTHRPGRAVEDTAQERREP